MMTTRILAGIASALAALALAGCSTGPDDFSDAGQKRGPEQQVISRLMAGIGAVDPADEPIAYQPRAPLVMPPRRELPAPQGEAAPAAPNWPNDPDVAEREARLARRASPLDPSKTWSPEELSKYRIPGAGQVRPDDVPVRPQLDESRPMSPDKLRAGKINVPEEYRDPGRHEVVPDTSAVPAPLGESRPVARDKLAGAAATARATVTAPPSGVATRRTLVEPPVAYRQPSPKASMELPSEETPPKWAPSWWPF